MAILDPDIVRYRAKTPDRPARYVTLDGKLAVWANAPNRADLHAASGHFELHEGAEADYVPVKVGA